MSERILIPWVVCDSTGSVKNRSWLNGILWDSTYDWNLRIILAQSLFIALEVKKKVQPHEDMGLLLSYTMTQPSPKASIQGLYFHIKCFCVTKYVHLTTSLDLCVFIWKLGLITLIRRVIAGFPNFSTIDILGQIIIHFVHCRMHSGIPGLYFLDANGNPYPPSPSN